MKAGCEEATYMWRLTKPSFYVSTLYIKASNEQNSSYLLFLLLDQLLLAFVFQISFSLLFKHISTILTELLHH